MPNLVQYYVLSGGMDDSEKCLGIKLGALDTQEIVFSKWEENFPQLKTIVSTARFDANASSNGISAVLWKERDVRI
jgi:2-dehydro-3-deoxygluconokinase